MPAAWPITLDPVWSARAWALIFGIAVSTFFTLIVMPVAYFMAYGNKGNGEDAQLRLKRSEQNSD